MNTTVLWGFVITNGFLVFALLIAIIIRGVHIYKLYRRKTYAIILDDDLHVKKIINLAGKTHFFKYDKGTYNIRDMYVKHESRRYLFYRYGFPDPINIVNMENSRMEATTYKAILDMERIKALNTPGIFGNINWKVVLLVGGGVLLVIYLLTKGQTPA